MSCSFIILKSSRGRGIREEESRYQSHIYPIFVPSSEYCSDFKQKKTLGWKIIFFLFFNLFLGRIIIIGNYVDCDALKGRESEFF